MTAGFAVAFAFAFVVALSTATLAALLMGTLRRRRYRAVFRLSARRDDAFTCRGRQTSSAVVAAPHGLDLPPETMRRGQTAILTLTVAATSAGRWFDPFIEVQHDKVKFRQYFERGVVGRRRLNLSPIFQDKSGGPLGRVRLRGGAVRWKEDALLTVFDGAAKGLHLDEASRVLVLGAHPDDPEIAAFGVYAGSASSTWVVTVTAGDAPDGRAARNDVDALGMKASLRVQDSLTMPLLGNVPQRQCLNLAYPDGRLQEMQAAPVRPFRLACEAAVPRASLRRRNALADFQAGDADCTWDSLVADLRRVLAVAHADVVVCPHPTIDAHPDHAFTALALERALRGHPQPPRHILLYAVHIEDVPLFPFGAADSVVSLPPWKDEAWVAESLLSLPLDPRTRRAKHRAVAASHDLRNSDGQGHAEPATFRRLLTGVKQEVSAFVAGTARDPVSFLRRAPRPNELFFVVSAAGLGELADRLLAQVTTAAGGHGAATRDML